jgi:MFS transporter, DHA1 family, multidrug resistance protein
MWRRNLYAVGLSQILSVTGFGFVMPFIPFYIQELGVTDPEQLRWWTGILSSGPALTMAIMAPVWGLVADRWGKKPMMLRAMFFGAVILSLLAATRSVQAVLVLRLAQGFLTGTVTASAALVASGTPKDRLGYALGMLSSSTFIGISIGPMIGGLVAEWAGYRLSFLIGGAMLAIGFFLVLLLVQESDTATAGSGRSRAPGESTGPGKSTGSGKSPGRLSSILTGSMMGLFLLILMLRFVRSLPIPFLPLFIQEMRGEIAGSATATGLISAGRGVVTAVAAITVTRIGDRHSRLVVVGVLVGVAGLFSLPIFFTRSIWSFSGFLILSTFFLGGVEPLVQADLSSRVPANRRGLLFGVQTSISNMGWFAAPLVGSFVSIRFGIAHIFLTLTIFLFITVAMVFIVHGRSGKDARHTNKPA